MDFVQTMKDWRRMCETIQSQNQQKSNAGWCNGCPIQGYCVIDAEIKDSTDNAFAIIKKRIQSWAAENPEPVYPTWEEYLDKLMKLDMMCGLTDNHNNVENYIRKTQIPAELAQRLGLKPKEG